MKTLKNTLKTSMVIAAIAVVSIAQSFAKDSTKTVTNEVAKEERYMKELYKESDIVKFERDLINAGIITCESTTKVKVLGVNDEIVYEGEITAFENPNAKLQKWMAKADHIITVGDTSFYKIF